MTEQEILVLMARVLGGNVDTGEGSDTFISTGPASTHTLLQGDERRITRVLNAINVAMGLIDSGVLGFDERFTNVIGSETGDDKEIFAAIGKNLIRAIHDSQMILPKKVKQSMLNLIGQGHVVFPNSILDFSLPWSFEVRVKVPIAQQSTLFSWNAMVEGALRGVIFQIRPDGLPWITWRGATTLWGSANVAVPIGEWISIWFIHHGVDANGNNIISYGYGPSISESVNNVGVTHTGSTTAIEAIRVHNIPFRIGAGMSTGGAVVEQANAQYEFIKFYQNTIFVNPVAEYRFDNRGVNNEVVPIIGYISGTSVGTTEQIVEVVSEVTKESIGLDNVDNIKQLPATYDSNSDGIVDYASGLEFGMVNYSLTINRNIPLISFTSDDGRIEEWNIAKPIFEEYGIPKTIAVFTRDIGRIVTAGTFMNVQQLQILKTIGWDLVSHGHTHMNYNTVDISAAEIDMRHSYEIMKLLGFDADLIVLPFGGTNRFVRNVARNYFKAAFNIHNSNPNVPGTLENMSLWRHRTIGEEGATVQNSIDAIDNAISAANGSWLVFYNHGWLLTTPELIQAYKDVVAYAVARQAAGELRIVGLREGLRLRGNLLEAGDFEDASFTRIDRNGQLRFVGGGLQL